MTTPSTLDVRDARAVAFTAACLAIVADLLLFNDPFGLGFPIWIALIALSTVALMQRCGRHVPHESLAWLTVAVFFACGVAWRASDALRSFDVLVAVVALGMVAITLSAPRNGLLAARLRDTVFAAAGVLGTIAVGAMPLAFRELLARHERASLGGRVARIIRPTALAAIVLIVFGTLLRSADPIFASLLALPDINLGTVIAHTVFIGFVGWIVAGWARAALRPTDSNPHAAFDFPFALGSADITAMLGALIVLFVAFVAAQLGWFFGGEQFLRARTGLTAASYARSGFFQTVWAVLLVIPVLVGSRAILAPDRTLARRHTMLSLPIVALLGATIVSAVLRLKLYVHFYGLTTDRLYPLVFLAWIAIVLAWMCVTVLRNDPRAFAAGAVISGLAALMALNIMNPDALVARVDVARTASETPGAAPIDLVHLASLSGDAAPLAARAVIAAPPTADGRCAAARTLVRQWGVGARMRTRDDRPASWRWWNAGEQYAEGSMLAYDGALRRAMHDACAPAAQR
ncbi:MAG TPA: DUF4173 domain-containing protein [Gemmatimonadaceae bacterium]|jgi:hypothetical protein